MNEIISRNRSLGPEAAMQLVEERAAGGFSTPEIPTCVRTRRRIRYIA